MSDQHPNKQAMTLSMRRALSNKQAKENEANQASAAAAAEAEQKKS